MGLSSKIFLDKRYTKQNGEQAIKIRITLDRKSIEVPAGYTIDPNYWNERTMRIKSGCPSIQNVTRLNNMIHGLQVSLEDKLIGLQASGEINSLTLKQLKANLMDKGEQRHYIITYCDQVISQIKNSGRIGNARVYQTLNNSVSKFLKSKDIPINNITFKWLKNYEAWYLGKGNSLNGLSVHMRTLRALLNRAIKERIINRESYPFEQYRIRTEKTAKRAMSIEELDSFRDFTPQTPGQARAKDYFLMSFYMMGASFIDLALLRLNNINNDRIDYKRKKTGQLHSIKITPVLQAILDRYTQTKTKEDDTLQNKNPFILDVVKSTDPERQYAQAKNALKRYNKSLKEIGIAIKVKIPLTSYVARHTYATVAKFKEVPISVISQALGHSNLKTTEIYLAQFGNDILDQYNAHIIGEEGG